MSTLLQKLQQTTQVDIDSFDVDAIQDSWQCVDATSNQAEIYSQISKPANRALLEAAVKSAGELLPLFPGYDRAQVAVDICTVQLARRVAEKVPGSIHIMANPRLAFNEDAIIAQGRRYQDLLRKLAPTFDVSRIVMKVAATWEGLQACKVLKREGLRTLATAVFAPVQSILAAEAGCVSVSPFLHELKAHFDDSFHDDGPFFGCSLVSQAYFEKHSLPTKVKACANLGVEEAMALAGVSCFTIMLDDIRDMASRPPQIDHHDSTTPCHSDSLAVAAELEKIYIDNEAKFKSDFRASNEGKDLYRVMQAITIFGDFQDKLEMLMSRNASEMMEAAGKF